MGAKRHGGHCQQLLLVPDIGVRLAVMVDPRDPKGTVPVHGLSSSPVEKASVLILSSVNPLSVELLRARDETL